MKESSSGAISKVRWVVSLGAIFLSNGIVSSQVAWAQDPTPPPPPASDMAAPAVPTQAPPPMMAPPPAAPVIATPPPEPTPPTAAEAMPASRPDVLPPIQVGAWTRVGGIFQSGTDQSKVDDFRMDNAYIELHAGGKIHKKVGVTLNLNGNGANYGTATANTNVGIMDAIVQFDFQDEFHVWAGRLLVPVDRANASGPFFMIPWNYPGFGGGSPKEGPYGRNNGAVVWGDIAGGKLTYLVGAFDNGNVATSPLYSGRLRLALWDPEPGFWGNASFFGEKDVLSIGVGGQYQKNGSFIMALGDKDWTDINGDILMEKKLGGGSWVTAEAAYYHFNVHDGQVSDSAYGLLAYATPTIGVGNIQPMVRYQWLNVKAVDDTPWNLDAAVSYLIKGPALRVIATYSHTKFLPVPITGADVTANSIQIGAQAIFF